MTDPYRLRVIIAVCVLALLGGACVSLVPVVWSGVPWVFVVLAAAALLGVTLGGGR